jgi:hypothetical protein
VVAEQTHLIEEDILAISALGCKLLQVPILADTVLEAQLLPELTANCRLVLAGEHPTAWIFRGECGVVVQS